MIHPSATVGNPPEHRDWKFGDPVYEPVIDPTAQVNAHATIDAGLKSHTTIGPRTLVMKSVHIGHDCVVGADCELAPHTVLGGHVVLEDRVRCGIGALLKPFVRVGEGARIGMGAVVVKDVPAGETWVGNPARRLDKPFPDPTEPESLGLYSRWRARVR